jgi:hypothetical protein
MGEGLGGGEHHDAWSETTLAARSEGLKDLFYPQSRAASRRLFEVSFALGDKAGIITFVDEDMSDKAACGAQGDPPASARRGIVVGALP